MAESQPKNYLGIVIDESKTASLPEYSQYLVKQHYARENETIQEALARAATCWGSNQAHAQRLYNYSSDGWFMYASPTFSNAILKGESPRNLPISCFLPLVNDDIPSLLFQKVEFALLSVIGGGVGQDWSGVRPVSKKAPGPIPFIHENDGGVLAWKQGSTRRGALAASLGILHPDSPEFMKIRTPTGDSDRKSLNIHHTYNIPDSFMEALERGDEKVALINPSNGKQEGEVNPREHFIETIKTRGRTGEPFMYFTDTANNSLPLPQRLLGMKSHGTNLCTEITLPAARDRTPVCCLSSINAEKEPEFRPVMEQFVSDLIEMLDNVLTFFINNVNTIADNYPDEFDRQFLRMILSKIKKAAESERSIGLGLMGFHYLLQRKGIPYESQEALDVGAELTATIKQYAHEASCRLGVERGVPPDITNYLKHCEENHIRPDPYWETRRNLHLLAFAPNANNSVILATTQSCEPLWANIYSQEMRIGIFTVKNRYLEALLEKYGKNTDEVWNQIADDEGSVKNLTFLTDRERDTYKTFMELDQMWVVEHAAVRQPHVCQAQSVNFAFLPGTDINYAAGVHYMAWKKGLKSVYYYRTETGTKVERVSKQVEKQKLEEVKKTIVYGTPQCVKCGAAKALLTANGIEYEYVDLVALGKTAAEVTGRPVRSVPQIYVDGEYVGGLEELKAHLSKKALEAVEDSGECVACEG